MKKYKNELYFEDAYSKYRSLDVEFNNGTISITAFGLDESAYSDISNEDALELAREILKRLEQ